jgi:asparagine synthase (glutamine-hydrolysing)
MCGIVGLVRGSATDEVAAERMNQALAHRGPDDAGIRNWSDHGVTLGQRRLSIIDLSPLGRNPMANEDGSVWIVYNGEIYNFQALRRELEGLGHTFRSHSDTEVVLHAYEQWGDDHVHRLRGMFAYALYDRRRSSDSSSPFRLLLVRDRLGIKPLFYYSRPGSFAFASEIKGILACDDIDRTVDWTALFDFLTYLYVPAPKTAYTHIRKLPPAHYLVFDGRSVSVREYWSLRIAGSGGGGKDGFDPRALGSTLEEVVRLHLVSDVPVGVLLSGGIDSSAITALSSRAAALPLQTFSMGFDVAEHSELPYADLVAQHCRTRHTSRVVGRESLDRMLPRVIRMYDEPFADTSAIPTFQVVAAASPHVKVLLSGDGGDELFAGYTWYRTWLARQGIDRLPLAGRREMLSPLADWWRAGWRGKGFLTDLSRSAVGRYAFLMELFNPRQKRALLSPRWAREFEDYDDYWYFKQFWREDLDPLTRLQYLDLKTFLPDDILTKVDRASMASSVEVRPPLLDHELVEQVFAMPSSWRLHQGEQKWLLKRAMQDYLPAAVLERDKKGFSAPMTPWIGAAHAWVQAELGESSRITEGSWLVPDLAGRVGRFPRGAQVWGLLVLQRWLAAEIEGHGVLDAGGSMPHDGPPPPTHAIGRAS